MKKNKTKKEFYKPILATMLLALYLGIGWYFVTSQYSPEKVDGFDISSGQAFTSRKLHESLDIRTAKKANYPSASLTKTQIVENVNGIEKSIVKYDIKADNLTGYGLMYLPSGNIPDNGFPVVVLLHAYRSPSEYMTTRGYETDMMHYAENGFAVIKPDFRGQGLSSDSGKAEGANYSMAYNTDTLSLVSAIKQTAYLKSSAINVWGHSMGAYVGLRASVLSSSIKTAILLAGPVADFSTTFEAYTAPSDVGNPIAAENKEKALLKFGTPNSNPNFWKNASPINFISKNKTYYQIHVGAKDLVVPPQFSAELDLKLANLGRNHGYFIYPNGDHDLMSERQAIWDRSLSVLAR